MAKSKFPKNPFHGQIFEDSTWNDNTKSWVDVSEILKTVEDAEAAKNTAKESALLKLKDVVKLTDEELSALLG